MHQGAAQHPGDELDVGVRVLGVARPPGEVVVVVGDQRAEGDVVGVVEVAEGEGVVRHAVRFATHEPFGSGVHAHVHTAIVAG